MSDTYNWMKLWRQAGVPDKLLSLYVRKWWETDCVTGPPEGLTKDILTNDDACGLAPFTFGKRPECSRHDWYSIFDKHGRSLEPWYKTQARFLEQSMVRAGRGAVDLVTGPIYGVVGSLVGSALMLFRNKK